MRAREENDHMRQDAPPGFTLIEILVVVLIIGLLTTVLATNLIGRAEDAKIKLGQTQIKNLSDQIELYRLDNGRYPTTDQGIEALTREPASEPRPRNYPRGGYVKSDGIIDPWGAKYKYEAPGSHNTHSFDLSSNGGDGVEGGEDDITNWDDGI
jgi:general secretion pathway protein G